MAGASLKFFKVFTNISNTKSVLTNKCLLPAHQSIACVKQSADKSSNLPEKPKRPPSSYLMFFSSIRQKLVEQNPESRVPELAKLAGQQWKTCDPSVKSTYEENYKKNLAEYQSAKENFEAKLTPEMKVELIAAAEKAKKESSKRKQKKDQKKLGKPKKPSSPWSLFLQSKSGTRGDHSFSEWVKIVSQEWYSVDSKTKDKQNEDFKLALTKYHKDMEQWEEKMVRAGRSDLVRTTSQAEPKRKVSLKLTKKKPVKKAAKK